MRLGGSLIDARRFDEAEQELRQAHAALVELKDPRATDTMWLLAAVFTHDGRLAEAEAMLAPSLAQEPTNPMDLARFKRQLGQLRSAQGRHEEAASLLQDAATLFQESGSRSQAAVSIATLGGAQVAAGNAAAAIVTLQRADALLGQLHPHGSPDHADLLIDLARAQLALGHSRDAVAAAGRAEEFWNRFDARNRQAGLAAHWHARAQLAARRELEAGAVSY
jgi:tetratricopeptide (TPR) repeat protein